MIPTLNPDLKNKLIHESGLEIVITTHHKPDGDAMGSSLSLWSALNQAGHRARVVTPTNYAHFLHWMPGHEDVIIYEEDPSRANFLVQSADLIFCLDFNDLKRINDLGLLVDKSEAIKVMIDHHQDPEEFADYTYITTETSSTCELIYQFLCEMGWTGFINSDVAACIYTGIMTDTGSFRYPSTSKGTHLAIAGLMDTGFDHSKIHEAIFNNNRPDRLKLLGYVLSQKLEILEEYNTALIWLNREELERYHVQTGDTEGFVNWGLSVTGVKFAALIIDRTKLVKMSFRSIGDFPCNEFASQHFGGGGHKNAAGGASTESLETVIDTFKGLLPVYKDKLS